MPPYRGPEREHIPYQFKWIRAGNEIFVSKPNDRIEHRNLARQDGILDTVEQFRDKDPVNADGGLGRVRLTAEDRIQIVIRGVSAGFKLPVEEVSKEARKKTVTAFQEQSHDCDVSSTWEFE